MHTLSLLAFTPDAPPPETEAFLKALDGICEHDRFRRSDSLAGLDPRPDVVLLPTERPGDAPIEQVHRALPDTPVVLVLADAEGPAETLAATRAAGAQDYLDVHDRDPALICRVVRSARLHLENTRIRDRYRILLDRSPDGFWINDLEGRILEVNPAYAAMVGYRPEAMPGMVIGDLEMDEDSAATRAHIRRILETGSDRFQTRHRHRDGGVVHLDVSAHLLEEHQHRIMAIFRDITQQKTVQAALAHSERRFRDVATAAGEYIWEVDPAGVYQFVTDPVEALLGRPPAELLGRTPFDFMPADEAERVRELLGRWADRRQSWQGLEHRSIRADGGIAWQRVSGLPMFDEYGRLTGFRGTGRDITAEKQAQEARARLTQRLRLATRAAGLGIWDLDLDSGRLEWDAGMFRIYGLDAEQFDHSVDTWIQALAPETAERATADFRAGMRSTAPYASEFRIRRGDGSLRDIRALAQAVHDDTGEPVRVVGINEDITDQRLAERRLREQTRQLTAVLETADDAVVTADSDGRIQYFNPAAERMFGHPAASMVGEFIERLMPAGHWQHHHDPGHRREGDAPRLTGRRRELQGMRADGEAFPVEPNITDTGMGEPRLYVGIIRDLSERKAAEKALARIRENLAEAQRIGQMGSWVLDLGRNHLWWSDQVFRIFGETPQSFDATYEAFLHDVHPEDREKVEERVQAALAGQPYRVIHRVVAGSGELRWVVERGEVERWNSARGGDPVRMRGTIQDITERRELEQALRQERNTARGIINSLPGIFYMITPEPRFTLWNRNLEEVLGLGAETLSRIDPTEIIAPEDREYAGRLLRQVFAEGFARFETRLCTADGCQPPYDLSAYRVDLPDGPPDGGHGHRHLPPCRPRKGVAPPRHHRRPHRPPEPPRLPRAGGRRTPAGRSLRQPVQPADDRRRPLQVGQRRARSRGRRPRPAPARRHPPPPAARGREPRPTGRRGIRRPAPRDPRRRPARAAERIRARLAKTPVPLGQGNLEITVSIGVTQWLGPDDPTEALFKRADDALYRSKGEGRNRVTRA